RARRRIRSAAAAHRFQHRRLVPRPPVRTALNAPRAAIVCANLRRDAERSMRLKDKVAIVTGGARGIGLAIAKRYAAEGARVTIADVDTAAGAAAAGALANARFIATDVGDARAAENVVAETCRAFGDLDIVVNNAGIIHGADFLELKEADFD